MDMHESSPDPTVGLDAGPADTTGTHDLVDTGYAPGDSEASYEGPAVDAHVDGQTGGGTGAGGDAGTGGSLTLTINGQTVTGQETVDANQDGTPDTAVFSDNQGDAVYATDTDGDGRADHIVVADAQGQVIDQQHTGPDGSWIDDGASGNPGSGGGGTDVGGGTGTSTGGGSAGGTLSVEVNGQTVSGPETIDLDGDGRPDTAVVDAGNGDRIALSDLDGDGTADHIYVLDPTGHIIDSAHLGQDGQWIDDGTHPQLPPSSGDTGGGSTGTGGEAGTGGSLTLTINGQTVTGQETVDANQDGTPDTAVFSDNQGEAIYATDTDGDGRADHIVVADAQGQVIDQQHTGPDGSWIDDGAGANTGGSNFTYAVDAETGEWIRR